MVASLAPIAQSQEQAQPSHTRTLVGWVLVPAVQGQQGRLINVTVQITYPGSGRVSVYTELGGEGVSELTRLSVELAVRTASVMAGVSWKSFDTTVTFRVASEIAGPSGGLAVALATYLMLYLNSNVSIAGAAVTGAITPHGLASRVGGIPEKCAAAMRQSATLFLPLANKAEAPTTCGYVAVTGLLNATRGVLREEASHTLHVGLAAPQELRSMLRELTYNISRSTEEVLLKMPVAARTEYDRLTRPLLQEAAAIAESNPYAAASIAFSAYVTALRGYYHHVLTKEGLSAARQILDGMKRRAAELESKLSSMPPEGSQLYVELLGLSYARLADARYNMGFLERNLNNLDAGEIASRLAYVDGRLETVSVWMRVAEAMRDKGARISKHSLLDVSVMLRDYARISGKYAVEYVDYVIANYPLDENTKRYLAAVAGELRSLLKLAEEEYARGNIIASLGYYRESLSKSADMVTHLLTADRDAAGVAYYEELERIWAIVAARAYLRGAASIVSVLYYEYAEYRASRGDYVSALELMGEAVMSAATWSLNTLSRLAYPLETAPAQEPGEERLAALVAWSLLLIAAGLTSGIAVATVITYLSIRKLSGAPSTR